MNLDFIRRITPTAGILGVLFIGFGSLLSAVVYVGAQGQRYSPLNHWVSELGEVGVSQGAAVFNAGLVIGGICSALFMFGLSLWMHGAIRWVFGAAGVLMGILGSLVGLFPMNNLLAHTTAAAGFFLAGGISIGLFSLYNGFSRQLLFPRWLVLPGVMTVGSFVLFSLSLLNIEAAVSVLETPEVRPAFWLTTTLEWLVVIGLLVWMFFISLRLRTATDEEIEAHAAAVLP